MAAGFLAAFFFAIILYLLRLVIRTRGSMVWRAGFPCETSWTISSARTSYATPRVSPRSLFDEVSETLAVVRNVALSRVGSVASVGATTSSIAIQNVLIQRLHPSSQEIAKIFFHAMPGEMLRVRDFHDVSRPLEGSSTHRMRTMRDSVVRSVRGARRDQNFARVAGAATGRRAQLMNFTSFIRCE